MSTSIPVTDSARRKPQRMLELGMSYRDVSLLRMAG
jgi:hypothetical protein